VGERACELWGCTNQLALLEQAGGEVAGLGIRVLGASTEPADRHAYLDLAAVITRVHEAHALLFPHTVLDSEPHLLRRTLVVGDSLRGLVVEDITDSVAHTQAILDAPVENRLAHWSQLAGREPSPTRVREVHPNGADSVRIVGFGTPPLVAKVGPSDVIRAEAAFVRRVDEMLTAAGRHGCSPSSSRWTTRAARPPC
jgi:hypothetical protein